jgi:hypothetical protein
MTSCNEQWIYNHLATSIFIRLKHLMWNIWMASDLYIHYIVYPNIMNATQSCGTQVNSCQSLWKLDLTGLKIHM